MSVIPDRIKPKAWLALIAGEILLIVAVAGLVLASIYLRHYQRSVCLNQRNAFAYVHDLNGQRIASLRKGIQLDAAAGRTLKAKAGRVSLAKALALQNAVSPPDC